MTNGNLLFISETHSTLCGDLNRNEIQKRGDVYIGGADSPGWTVKQNIIVKQLEPYPKMTVFR